MSQYLSHLADLTFNQLDVVQPRLSSRFENQDHGVAPVFGEQEIIHEPATPPIHSESQVPSTQTSAALTSARPVLDSHTESVKKAPTPTQPLLSEPKTSFSERTLAETNAQPMEHIEAQVSFAPEAQRPISQPQFISEPKLPALKPSRTDPQVSKIEEPQFKEELAETHLPLLQPVKLASVPGHKNSQSRQLGEFSLPITDNKANFVADNLQLDSSKNRQEQISQSAVKDEPTTKPASVKPESIRIKPIEQELISEPSRHAPPLAGAPVDIAPPSIHVSIGRIEIRANQTSAPAANKSRQPSTMSLDDYAKRKGDRE